MKTETGRTGRPVGVLVVMLLCVAAFSVNVAAQTSLSDILGTGGGGYTPVPGTGGSVIDLGNSGGAGTCQAPAAGPTSACGGSGVASQSSSSSSVNLGAGNPINLVTGNKYQVEVDMAALPGELGLEVVRHYNSANGAALGLLGAGWKLSYETQLYRVGQTLQILQADGARRIFDIDPQHPNRCAGAEPDQGWVEVQPQSETARYVWHWTHGDAAGRQLHFSARGLLMRVVAASGATLRLERSPAGQLLKVIDPQGRALEFLARPKADLQQAQRASRAGVFVGVQRIHTPLGDIRYQHGNGTDSHPANLVRVERAGHSRYYHYEHSGWPHALTGISVDSTAGQPPQRLSTWHYDPRGRAIQSQSAQTTQDVRVHIEQPATPNREGRTLVSYGPAGQEQHTLYRHRIINGQYRLTEALGAACATCSPGNQRYRYDAQGRLIEITELAPVILRHGQPQSPVQALRSVRHRLDAQGRTVQIERVAYQGGREASRTLLERRSYADARWPDKPTRLERPSVVAGQQHRIQLSYNEAGQVTEVTETGWIPAVQKRQATALQRTTRYEYARIQGRSVLQAVDGPLPGAQDTTHHEWDAQGAYLLRAEYPMGLTHRYDQRDIAGQVVRETPPDGVAIEHGYLPTGQAVRWQRGPAVAQVTHDDQGRPVRIDLPDGEVRRLGYGAAPQAVAVVSNTGQAQWLGPAMTSAMHSPQRPNMGPLWASMDRTWSNQRMAVDDFGRLIGIHSQETGWEWRDYDEANRLTRRELADGTVWRWQRDALGRIAVHEVSRPGAETQRSTLQYEGVRLMGMAHPKETERYAYDELGRVKTKTILRSALRYAEAYEYDAADRVTVVHLPEGGALRYRWGVGRQLQAIEHDDGRASAVLGATLSGWLGWGRQVVIEPLTATPAPASTPTTAPPTGKDVLALLQARRQAERGYRWGNGVELRWHLDEQGQLAGMRYVGTQTPVPWHEQLVAWLPSAQAVEHGASHPALIELGYQYDPWGRMSQRQQDGLRTGYAYDGLGRLLASQTLPKASSAAANDAGQAQVEYYAYDMQGQMLASLTGGQTTDWRDLRTQRDASGLPQRIEVQGVQRQLSYSADRRLIEVRQGGQVLASYSHNTHGQRIGKTLVDGRSTQYLWGGGRLVGETVPEVASKMARQAATREGESRLARRYVYAHGVPVAVIDHEGGVALQTQPSGAGAWASALWRWVSESAPQIASVHSNEIGTPIAATDAQGKLIWRAEYSAYGVIKVVQVPASKAAKEPIFMLNLRLSGQYFDAETGWHDNGLRTYDPQRGAYLEPDPLGPVPNWRSGRLLTQPYAYANHNPLIYADPTGLILFAFDGTGNDESNPKTLSNVVKFSELYQEGKPFYITGPGTTDPDTGIGPKSTDLGGIVDSGTSYTGIPRVDAMVKYLQGYADSQDDQTYLDLDIVGFSRGAAEAREFANRIVNASKDGWYQYKDGEGNMKCQKVSFRFMGLFDTVLSTHTGSYNLSIPTEFGLVAHAVALNEYRSIFPGESIMPSHGATNTEHLVEMGFLGAHSDIGGGFEDGGLAQVALVWMVDQAKSAGITMGNPERTVSATLTYHDKSDNPGKEEPGATGFPEDRVIRYRDGVKVFQKSAQVSGMTYADTQQYMTPGRTPNFSEQPAGTVDMKAYLSWLEQHGYNLNMMVN